MNRKLTVFGILTVAVFAIGLTVTSVESQTSQEDLYEMEVVTNVEAADANYPGVDGNQYVSTAAENVAQARSLCCDSTTNAKKQKKCLTNIRKRANKARRLLRKKGLPIGDLAETIRDRMTDISRASCSDLGDYKALF